MFTKVPFIALLGMLYMGALGTATLFQLDWLKEVLIYGTVALVWAGGIYACFYQYRRESKIVFWMILAIVVPGIAWWTLGHVQTLLERTVEFFVLLVFEGPFFAGFLVLLHLCAIRAMAIPIAAPTAPGEPGPLYP